MRLLPCTLLCIVPSFALLISCGAEINDQREFSQRSFNNGEAQGQEKDFSFEELTKMYGFAKESCEELKKEQEKSTSI